MHETNIEIVKVQSKIESIPLKGESENAMPLNTKVIIELNKKETELTIF